MTPIISLFEEFGGVGDFLITAEGLGLGFHLIIEGLAVEFGGYFVGFCGDIEIRE